MEENTKKLITQRQFQRTAALDPRCKVALLIMIGCVSYFLNGEICSLVLVASFALFIAVGNGGKWAAKMLIFYIVIAYLNALLRYVSIPVLSVIMSVFGVTILKLVPIAMMGIWILHTTQMDDLMVSLQRIQSFTREQFCSLSDETRIQYGLRTVYPEREAAKYQLKPAHKSNDGLSVSNLSFAYKKGPDVLRNINFEAHKGDVIGILGHNGAGKTTLLSIMTGLLKEKTGSIRYNGKKLSPRQRRNLSYLVMQDTDYQLFGSSVEEELSLGIENDCSGKVTETLEALELGAYRECHPASLSGGQKQRVTIGAAIVKDSPVIYFDEPTSGLDYDSMVRVSHLIEQLAAAGVIIFVVSHDFEFITRTCSEVLQLDGQDSIKNQVLTPEILLSLSKQYFN